MGEIENQEQPEKMASFFDLRATGYDVHIKDVVYTDEEFEQFYQAISQPIAPTEQPLKILDLGCGTGLELAPLLQRVPNAQITGMDVSINMLRLLEEKYPAQQRQITLKAASYLDESLGSQEYDYIISAMSLHHLLPDTKQKLYQKIYLALKPGGQYIEGDTVTRKDMENEFLAEYEGQIKQMLPAANGHYHIDIPFSIDTQKELLLGAGFKQFKLIWEKDYAAVWNAAVYVATT